MNSARLLAHYDRISDAPDAIARLRRFILDLAVRGRLVPQDPRDASPEACLAAAREVLERRSDQTKRQRWTRSGAIASEERPRDIPSGWVPARVNDTGLYVNGLAFKPSDWKPKGLPIIRIQNLTDQSKEFNYAAGEFPDEVIVREGDILVSWSATLEAFIWSRGDGVLNQHIFRVLPAESLTTRRFLHLLLRSAIRDMADGRHAHGLVMTHINRGPFLAHVVLIPPMAEQHRIVAKVDELMALCDRLEGGRADRETTRDRLTTASLARLNAPDPDTFQDDARFALSALPALTTRSDQIKQLRQTILNLAVRGKLVPQDRTDAPADLPISVCEQPPPDNPAMWRYTRLANLLAEDTRNGYSRKPDDALDGTPILRISAGTLRPDGVVAEEEHKLISGITPQARVQYGLQAGDLLACRFNGNKAFVGRLTIFTDYLGIRPIYPDKLIRIRTDRGLAEPAFLQLAGDADIVRQAVEAKCATTVGNWGISASNLKEVQFPVPPLAEQRRIVAKVNELMVLCDRLEANLTTGDNTRRLLLEALLHEALTPGEGVAPEQPETVVAHG